MRKLTATAAVALLIGFTAAVTAGPYDTAPEARAYLKLDFGGSDGPSQAFHYGLRLDHDTRYTQDLALPPLFQIDFTRQGLHAANVQGLSVVRQNYRMAQAEESQPGFFGRIGNWFGNLFGGADSDDADYPNPDDPGLFTSYTALDWALLAVGLVGIGYVTTEIIDGSESPNPTENGNGGTTGDAVTPLGGVVGAVGGVVGGVLGDVIGYRSIAASGLSERDIERQRWLDGGTGQMGDLDN
jgi:hypothetical protein